RRRGALLPRELRDIQGEQPARPADALTVRVDAGIPRRCGRRGAALSADVTCRFLVWRVEGSGARRQAVGKGFALLVGLRRLLGATTGASPGDMARPMAGADTGSTMSASVIPSSSLK